MKAKGAAFGRSPSEAGDGESPGKLHYQDAFAVLHGGRKAQRAPGGRTHLGTSQALFGPPQAEIRSLPLRLCPRNGAQATHCDAWQQWLRPKRKQSQRAGWSRLCRRPRLPIKKRRHAETISNFGSCSKPGPAPSESNTGRSWSPRRGQRIAAKSPGRQAARRAAQRGMEWQHCADSSAPFLLPLARKISSILPISHLLSLKAAPPAQSPESPKRQQEPPSLKPRDLSSKSCKEEKGSRKLNASLPQGAPPKTQPSGNGSTLYKHEAKDTEFVNSLPGHSLPQESYFSNIS
uniref:Uncharacterized protein n=1 Tax=Sphaerodactylus townsendi TaxID=933632 RepID=A0ACB8F7P1_9SAUR